LAPERGDGDLEMKTRNYYEVLELSRGASTDEVRSAYRRLVRRYHPDLNPGDEGALERIKEVNAAYEVLCDPCSQAQYDRDLERAERSAEYHAPPVRRRPEPIYEEHTYVTRRWPQGRRASPIEDVTDRFPGPGYGFGGPSIGQEIDALFEAMDRLVREVEEMDYEAEEMVMRMLRAMRRRMY
jgi:curved DNA-binding protein CbpA